MSISCIHLALSNFLFCFVWLKQQTLFLLVLEAQKSKIKVLEASVSDVSLLLFSFLFLPPECPLMVHHDYFLCLGFF